MKLWHILLKSIRLLHPANRLLVWCILTIGISCVPFIPLLGLTLIIVFIAIGWVPQALQRSLRRMRWLLLALIIIFAWSTPGVYVASSWYAPSIDGLYAGIQQALRLIGVIAGLQIALRGMDQTMLLSACYQLSRPFAWLGADSARFAVRLGLTLYYAEAWLMGTSRISWRNLGAVFDAITQENQPQGIIVEILPFSHTDQWVSLGLVFSMVLLMIIYIGIGTV